MCGADVGVRRVGQQGLMTGCETAEWTTVFITRVAITGCTLSPSWRRRPLSSGRAARIFFNAWNARGAMLVERGAAD